MSIVEAYNALAEKLSEADIELLKRFDKAVERLYIIGA